MTKTYNVVTLPGIAVDGVSTFTVKVEILNEAGDVVLTGETSVVTDDPAKAYEYGETVFLTDLKRNMPYKLADMSLPTDPAPEPPPTEEPPEGV